MNTLFKYPRTPHIEGSRGQPGDEDLAVIPVSELANRHVVVEEKLDGANSGISFATDGRLLLQSRGHFLRGGRREKHFDLFKTWANTWKTAIHGVLGDRYVMYGEWLYAKHTIFYDDLPHYFFEFDVLDTHTGLFLSTERRTSLLAELPIVSAPVLYAGKVRSESQLRSLIRRSLFKSESSHERLRDACAEARQDPERICRETDPSLQAEGLYLKVEEDGWVRARFKYVRTSFLSVVTDSQTHWLDRPIVANRLRDGVRLFEGPQ